jgi:predicted amidohydrolase
LVWPLLAACSLILGLLSFGFLSLRASLQRIAAEERIRVAAVVVDGAQPQALSITGLSPMQSSVYRDVAGTIGRYEAHVERAAAEGALLIVLPEVAALVDNITRPLWVEAGRTWARRWRVTLVLPYVDDSEQLNELLVIAPDGTTAARYEKQHPGPLEAARRARMAPSRAQLAERDNLSVSTVICVDLDYADLVSSLKAAGGVLAVPANDWPELEELHHSAAVWSAVMSGLPIVRATGHGISAIFDAAGRVLKRASSRHGAVVLVADVPVGTRKVELMS